MPSAFKKELLVKSEQILRGKDAKRLINEASQRTPAAAQILRGDLKLKRTAGGLVPPLHRGSPTFSHHLPMCMHLNGRRPRPPSAQVPLDLCEGLLSRSPARAGQLARGAHQAGRGRGGEQAGR